MKERVSSPVWQVPIEGYSIGGAVLAGGLSTRMGHDKASLLRRTVLGRMQPESATWLERQLDLLGQCGLRHRVVSWHAERPSPVLPTDVLLVRDRVENQGPLAGIEAVLSRIETSAVLVLAVDLQRMTPRLLSELIAMAKTQTGVIPFIDDRFEPLAAIYPQSCLTEVKRRLDEGRLSLQELIRSGCDDGWLSPWEVPQEWAREFANWNYPSDIE